MAIFYDEYLNEGSKENRALIRSIKRDANDAYQDSMMDLSNNRDGMGRHEYKAKQKELKAIKRDQINQAKNAIYAAKLAKKEEKWKAKQAEKNAERIRKNDNRNAIKILRDQQKRDADEKLASKAFGEACDYIDGCLNEGYEIDIDLLRESCEYVLDTLDEYDEY